MNEDNETEDNLSYNDRICTWIGTAIVGFGWTSFMALFLVDFLWMHAAPDFPIPDKNLVVAHLEHGACKYFSSGQEWSTRLMFLVVPVGMLGALLLPSMRNSIKAGTASKKISKLPKAESSIFYRSFPIGAAAALAFVFTLYKLFTPT